jgi:hypothetical protein
MAKLKEEKEKMEKMPKSRGAAGGHAGPVPGHNPDEAPGEINAKHFGHVKKTAKALHGSDPYCAAHEN